MMAIDDKFNMTKYPFIVLKIKWDNMQEQL